MSDGFLHYRIDKLSLTILIISGDVSTKPSLVEVSLVTFFSKKVTASSNYLIILSIEGIEIEGTVIEEDITF